jgi:SAM-dependent methyltransferase
MDPGRARQFYGSDYFQGGDYQDYAANEAALKRNFERLVRRMVDLRPAGELLELGCAFGYFLDLAREQWRVRGLDVSPAATAACRQRFGEAVICAEASSAELPRSHFDWVVGWDVIEHLDDPRACVRRAFELLRPGGLLALSTGDVSSFAARVCGRRWRLMTPPSHLTYFSRKGMRRLLDGEGFDEVSIGTLGYDRNLDFALFRLLPPRLYQAMQRRVPGLAAALRRASFYVDLGDVMLVVARRRID